MEEGRRVVKERSLGHYDQEEEHLWEWDRENDEPNQEIATIDHEVPDTRVADS